MRIPWQGVNNFVNSMKAASDTIKGAEIPHHEKTGINRQAGFDGINATMYNLI
jgi:hypothetical protein